MPMDFFPHDRTGVTCPTNVASTHALVSHTTTPLAAVSLFHVLLNKCGSLVFGVSQSGCRRKKEGWCVPGPMPEQGRVGSLAAESTKSSPLQISRAV